MKRNIDGPLSFSSPVICTTCPPQEMKRKLGPSLSLSFFSLRHALLGSEKKDDMIPLRDAESDGPLSFAISPLSTTCSPLEIKGKMAPLSLSDMLSLR